MGANAITLAVTMIFIGACVGVWVHMNTKKKNSE